MVERDARLRKLLADLAFDMGGAHKASAFLLMSRDVTSAKPAAASAAAAQAAAIVPSSNMGQVGPRRDVRE